MIFDLRNTNFISNNQIFNLTSFAPSGSIVYVGILKRYDGMLWAKTKLKNYDGNNFDISNLKIYKNSTWGLVNNNG